MTNPLPCSRRANSDSDNNCYFDSSHNYSEYMSNTSANAVSAATATAAEARLAATAATLTKETKTAALAVATIETQTAAAVPSEAKIFATEKKASHCKLSEKNPQNPIHSHQIIEWIRRCFKYVTTNVGKFVHS